MMITEKKIAKALKFGAEFDSNFENDLNKIKKNIVKLIEKTCAPNLIMEEIKEEIEKKTFYFVGKENEYRHDNLSARGIAC